MEPTGLVVAALCLLAGLVVGVLGFILYQRMIDEKARNNAQKEADRILNKAKSQAGKIERDAKNRAKDFETRARKNVENDIRKEKQRLTTQEGQLKDKEKRLEKDFQRKEDQVKLKMKEAEEKAQFMSEAEERLKDLEAKQRSTLHDLSQKLETTATMTAEQAKQELIKAFEDEAKSEAAQRVAEIVEGSRKEAQSKARQVLAVAIARYASEVSTEKTVTSIPLTSGEMKGKIIGREGRNIRALEAACGVDLIIDETPESVIISSFDALRREIARRSLEKLMEDGRVHPARIEEVVSKVKSEINESIREDAEKACFDLGVHGVHSNVLNVLGALKFRHADSQNLLAYSIEVATLCGLMAVEIRYDESLAKRAGLLHAIGRGLDHSHEGSYAQAGAEFLKRNGEKEDLISAIRIHTEDSEPPSVLGHLLQAAVNLTKARPGARRTMMETYIRRLEDLESVANSFDGVMRTYALQAGKEIRVMVDSGRVTDEQSAMLSRDIARKIERELNYQGQIKVAVIRETRIVEHAR
ncbi:MAG: ribonuclease Y [Bdellovibrionales bacterium]|nr:ribonuclease Y [Bdellovibrionales bacterium]